MGPNPDLVAELRKCFRGDIRLDLGSKILYSTDASIYQIEPAGVLIPRVPEDLQIVIQLAAQHGTSIVARGAGTSLAGQAIGSGLIVDCSRWLDRILEIDPVQRTAKVEPGVVLADLNRAAASYGLQFGPDPASAERATMGGVVANNATGAHSILYGMAADHILEAEVVLADGSLARLGVMSAEGLVPESAPGDSRHAKLQGAARQIRKHYSASIQQDSPKTWRNSAGYRINYLLPWAPGPPSAWGPDDYPRRPSNGDFNLATLLAGSEGTLAVIQNVTVGLVARPRHEILAILEFDDLAAACEAVPGLLRHEPAAIELVPRLILQAARRNSEFAGGMSWLRGDPAALLILEFSGDDPRQLMAAAKAIGPDLQIVEAPEDQAMVWASRKAGLGLLDSTPGPARPVSFIEDCVVPVEQLATFVRELQRILEAHGATGGIYGHASAGCLHARPVLDLKTARGLSALRQIAEPTLDLTLRLGGAMSSEHGDGLSRGEWLHRTYGEELIGAMRMLKDAADPDGILNPGKMLDAPPMDTQLRYGESYRTRAWTPVSDLSDRGGLESAIEQCNGQGACRKSSGVMCPSYQATREEMHSTRGRANLLRAMISEGELRGAAAGRRKKMDEAVFQALSLCLGCKGCLAECPSGVDMALLKSEHLSQHYRDRLRPLREYMFGYFGQTAAVMGLMPGAEVWIQRSPILWRLLCGLLGLAPQRKLPRFARGTASTPNVEHDPTVLLLRDPYSHHVDTEVEAAALALLRAAGHRVRALGRTRSVAALISKGFLKAAQREAQSILDELKRLDPAGALPLAVVEPPELEALRHDVPRLLPALSAEERRRFEQAFSAEELCLQEAPLRPAHNHLNPQRVLFHPHCHEKAGTPANSVPNSYAGARLLEQCGFSVELTDAGCCGMGGTFGFEAQHYELSQRIGELKLFPQIRSAPGAIVAATGGACRMHITDATQRKAEHPLVLAARALGLN